MRGSGRIVLAAVLPLLFLATACTGPDFDVEQPLEVDSCDQLVDVGIRLVNDYVYTLEETDLAATQGDPDNLPTSLVALNLRGDELDARIVELDCDAVTINQAIIDATSGIESDDPVASAFLDSVRGGIVAPVLPTYGEWQLESGTVSGAPLAPASGNPITLIIERNSASGFAGCNGYFYPVSLVDGVWSWPDGTASVTELTCEADGGEAADVAAIEKTYLAGLEMVARYELIDSALVLTGDGVTLRFIRDTGE
jgi:heat shock protein HslJ